MNKRFLILSLLSVCLTFKQLQAFDPVTVSVVSKFLAPIIEPIVKEVAQETFKTIGSAITKLQRKSSHCEICNKTNACKTKGSFSACKSYCQEIAQVGGYEIRIRFKDGDHPWNISECIRNGVASGLQNSKGKDNKNSVAVYHQKDLDLLIELIDLKIAAERILLTKGAAIKNAIVINDDELQYYDINGQELQTAPDQRIYFTPSQKEHLRDILINRKVEKALHEAEESRKKVIETISALIDDERFGNQ